MEPVDRSAGGLSPTSDPSQAPAPANVGNQAPAGAPTHDAPLPGDRVRDSLGMQATVVQPTISLGADTTGGVWLRLDEPQAGRWVRLPAELLVRSADGQYWCMASFDALVDANRASSGDGMFPAPRRGDGGAGLPPSSRPPAATKAGVAGTTPIAGEAGPARVAAGAELERPPAQAQAQATGPAQADDGPSVIPVIEEHLQIDKRTVVRGGLRLDKTVETRREVVDEPLMRDELSVERVPVNTLVSPDALPLVRHEGDTMIVPVFEEVLVVERRMLLKEEIRIHRVRKEFHAPQAIELRREHVSVRRIDEDGDLQAPRVDAAAGSREPVPMSSQPQVQSTEES